MTIWSLFCSGQDANRAKRLAQVILFVTKGMLVTRKGEKDVQEHRAKALEYAFTKEVGDGYPYSAFSKPVRETLALKLIANCASSFGQHRTQAKSFINWVPFIDVLM